ncbi:MAG: AsmA-like C-terminal region-containing protein [Candidatus Omnitrophota bacterium]
MLKFLKILLVITFSIAALLAAAYFLYKDTLAEKAEAVFEARLSEIFKQKVDIGAIKYLPLSSFSLRDVAISDTVRIQNITSRIDLLSILKEREFRSTVAIKGFKMKDIEVSATLKTESLKAGSYKDVFDPSLLKTISITGCELKTKLFSLEKIQGEVNIEKTGYRVCLYSDGLEAIFEAKSKDTAATEKTLEINGKVETDIGKLLSFSGPIGSFIKNCKASGKIGSKIFMSLKTTEIRDYELNARIDSDQIMFNNIKVGDIHGGLYVKKGRLNVPSVTATLYGGTVSSNLEMDLHDKNLPFLFTLNMRDVEFGNMLRDAINDKVNVYGKLLIDLSLKGNAVDSSAFTGNGEIIITDADLGPMPILTPLLGNIYGYLQSFIPGMEKVTITSAGATLDIRDRKIMSDDLVLWSEEVFITAKGHMDFNGTLDFTVENQLIQPEEEELDSWQGIFRRAITGFGKIISKAHLRGTIKKSKWEFEYLTPLKDMFRKSVREFINTSQ